MDAGNQRNWHPNNAPDPVRFSKRTAPKPAHKSLHYLANLYPYKANPAIKDIGTVPVRANRRRAAAAPGQK
ncbi:MAG: hypothetical protein JJ902_14275 [Roseibium sp.]|nr:hypothetical protein [Roseibium sp.]